MTEKEQSHLSDIISKIIGKAHGSNPATSPLLGDSFYARQAGIYQGSLNRLQEELERGTPLERIAL